MVAIAIISLIFYIYGLYCIGREMYLNEKKNCLSKEKQNFQFSILIYLLTFYLVLIYWFCTRKGFDMIFDIHKFDEDLWLLLLSITQLTTGITRYFKKVRGEIYLDLNKKK